MDKEKNQSHWEHMAKNPWGFGPTTKCQTIKTLEIDCLVRWIQKTRNELNRPLSILELGCGNAINGSQILEAVTDSSYVGIDFTGSLLEAAKQRITEGSFFKASANKVALLEGDIRDLRFPLESSFRVVHAGSDIRNALKQETFDIIFTDRALINLSNATEQASVLQKCGERLSIGGRLIVLEGSQQAHAGLNFLRQCVNLPPRKVAEFNVFLDETKVIEPLTQTMPLEAIENFSGLHDLMLYVVQPLTTTEGVVYDTPILKALTETIVRLNRAGLGLEAIPGQNRAWIWNQKPKS